MAHQYPTVYEEQPYYFTVHARLRMAQWNLRESEVLYAIRHGQQFHRQGIVFCFLGRKNFPKNDARQLGRLEGTTVLINPIDRAVITVYRNRQALHTIRGKVEYFDPDIHFGSKGGYHG